MRPMIEPRLRELIEKREWFALRESIAEVPAPDIADLLREMEKGERALVFTALPRQLASEVFAHLEPQDKDDLLKGLTEEETRRLLADMPPDDRAALFEELPGQVTQRLLNLLSPGDLAEVRQLLGYPEDSVGRLMTPDYVAVRPNWTIAHAIDHIRLRGKGSETISVIYVTDSLWHLLDALELQRFILANPSDTVEDIMDRTFVSLNALDDREQAVRTMERYDLYAVPVVDQYGVMLGIVTVDDILDVAQEEATEDFQRVAAVAPLGVSYREASIWSLYSKRIGWLVILILVNLISSGVIAAFEQTLATAIALAFFIPLLIGSGGNTGSQSATLMVRALSTGDVELREWARVALKELGVGLALAVTMGAAASLLGLARGGIDIAFVVGITMTAVVVVANLIGMALPFILTRFKLDPAVASSPLIATIMDATGLLIYFSVATWLLRL